MPIEVIDSSPVAASIAADPPKRRTRQNYPFDELTVGKSFRLPIAEANIRSLQATASKKSIDGKRFTVIKHENPPVVEVARIA